MKTTLTDLEIEINTVLIKNRDILKSIFDTGERTVSKPELIVLGFDFSCHTSRMKNQDTEQPFMFVYNYGIGKVEETIFLIVRLPY
jgi:hypothetical protein